MVDSRHWYYLSNVYLSVFEIYGVSYLVLHGPETPDLKQNTMQCNISSYNTLMLGLMGNSVLYFETPFEVI